MDRVEIRPGSRELPEDSLEKIRQKQQSAEIYPKEPDRPLQHYGETRGVQASENSDYVSKSKEGLQNAKWANKELQRVQQEKQSGLNRDASRDDLLRHENEVRISSDPATREKHKQKLKEITEPSDRGISDHEKYFGRQYASTPQRLSDVGRQTLSASPDALSQRENTVAISSGTATRENLRQQLNEKIAPDRQTTQHDLQASRADYEKYLSPDASPADRAQKREELNQNINGAARETTGKEIGHPSRSIWPNGKNDRAPDKTRGPER